MNTITITTYCCNCGKREQHVIADDGKSSAAASTSDTTSRQSVIRCKECWEKQVAAVHANEALPVGGTSCSEEYALRPLIGNRGPGKSACGGGTRVIRKGNTFS